MDYEVIENIDRKIHALLKQYVRDHSKSLIVRFDVHYPASYPWPASNEHISSCMAYVVKKYTRHGLDPHYIWVREQLRSSHPHYHCALLLNGQKTRSYRHVFHNVEAAWARTLGCPVPGCINRCLKDDDPDYNGKIIRRDAGQTACEVRFHEVLRQLSYLAKAYTKTLDYDGQRNFGCTRLQNL